MGEWRPSDFPHHSGSFSLEVLLAFSFEVLPNGTQVPRYPGRQFRAKESAFMRRDFDILKALHLQLMGDRWTVLNQELTNVIHVHPCVQLINSCSEVLLAASPK